MKKLITTLLFLAQCLLPLICLLVLHHFSLSRTIQQMESGTFGQTDAQVYLSKNSPQVHQNLWHTLSNKQTDLAVYLDDTTSAEHTIRYMMYTGDYVTLPMQDGRFFTTEDFNENHPVAVVGKKIKGIYTRDGKKYLNVKGNTYRVIGTVGYEDDSNFDHYIFINLLDCKNTDLQVYTFDFFSKKKSGILQDCKKNLKKENCKMELMLKEENFQETLAVSPLTIGFLVTLILCGFLCILLLTSQWIGIMRKDMGIRRLLGATGKQLTRRLMAVYSSMLAMSLLAGSFCCHFYTPADFNLYLKIHGLLALVMLFYAYGLSARESRIPITEVIKQ